MTFTMILGFALLGAFLGLDVVSFPQAMFSRPIVASTLAGTLGGSGERRPSWGERSTCRATATRRARCCSRCLVR